MSISGLSIYSAMNRNLIISKADETSDEKTVKKLNTAIPDANNTSIQTNQASVHNINNIKEAPQQTDDQEENQSVKVDVNFGVGQGVPVHTRKQTAPQDFTFDFSKKDDYQLVGARNKLEDVDVEKGISDMKKETVLDQYKYFINPSNLGTDQDGTVKIVGWD